MSAASTGLVVVAHRRHFRIHLDDGFDIECVQRGRAQQVACGDRVRVSMIAGGGVVDAVLPRTSLFRRSDAFHDKAIAANVTQVVAVVAPDVAVDEYLLNRWIIAAEAQGCRFVLVANKDDLPSFAPLHARMQFYATLGYPLVALSARHSVATLAPHLAGQHSVLIGQSGMGKSTIVNALAPEAAARVGGLSSALGSGKHTTTVSTLYRLPGLDDGWVVDSPGVKAFGIAQYDADALAHAFVEMRPLLGSCRFRDCRHLHEPGCAIQAAAAAGAIAPQRLALFHTLVDEARMARAHH
ncbi:MAG TPA: ribosome small subunit-dependent GTPase A [Casimicrobiaceae bacterium]